MIKTKVIKYVVFLLIFTACLSWISAFIFPEYPNSALLLLIIIALVLLYSVYLFRKILKPIDDLLVNIKLISDDKPIIEDGSEFHSYLHIIQERLQTFQTKISNRKEGFYTIIESIREVVWVQNPKGIIKVANKSALTLMDQTSVKDQYFWNVIRIRELFEAIDTIHRHPQDKLAEITFDEKMYLLSASHIELTGEIIFILHDISELKKLEKIKKEFVLNVSHELRTPLTSIKGFLETMEGAVSDENQNFLKIIQRNTDRMINIVSDLMILSESENISNAVFEQIETEDFIRNIQNIFIHKLKAKAIDLNFVTNDLQFFYADRFGVEQLFINLIDNAVKYTETGSISVAFQKTNNELQLIFNDTGIGISQEHLSRIFERFYVADKSRTKKFGGTGLGLSIVKHIVNLHKGEIRVESSVNAGTKFVITIPQNEQQ
jgi:two-component system, OmpR family, phosphate regulon sensor histidine kinase PhoR